MNDTVKQLERLREWGKNPLTKKSEKQQIKFALEESPTPIVKNPVLKKAINDQQIRRKNHYNKLTKNFQMITPAEYLKNKLSVIPCQKNTRKPIGDDWPNLPIDINRFKPGDNIGLHLLEHTDIDVDNQNCNKFLNKIISYSGLTYGRLSNPRSHILFAGTTEYKKWTMHKDFEPWFKNFRKKSTILELRSGKGFQSIVPGSIIDGEEVKWDKQEELKSYPGDIRKDIELVVFATMLSILFPPLGNRADFLFACGCLLAKWGKWSAEKINEFIYQIALHSGSNNPNVHKNIGTRAHKQLNRTDGRLKGLPALMGILKVSGEAIKDIFSVVNISIGEDKIRDLKMYDWGEYMSLDIPEPKFIVERLFKTKSINFISGPKGNGKTEWTLGLTNIISKSGNFLTYKVNEPRPVIYIDGEMDEYDLIERRVAYTQHRGVMPNYFNIIHYAQQVDQTIPDIKFELGQKLILKKINEVKEKTGLTPVLVLDNLRSLSNYKENDSDDWRPIGVWLKNLRALDVVSIVIDHHGKNSEGGPRGSSSKTDWANVSMFIKSISKGRTKGTMRMEIKFDKARGLRPDETNDYECEYDFDGNWKIVESASNENDEAIMDKIMELETKQNTARFEYERELDKQLEAKDITKAQHKKLVSKSWKDFSISQRELGEKTGVSAGKINQLKKDKYSAHILKKSNEKYSKENNIGPLNE